MLSSTLDIAFHISVVIILRMLMPLWWSGVMQTYPKKFQQLENPFKKGFL